MSNVYLSLGSNQGNRIAYLQKALQAIKQQVGNVVSVSPLFETEPWGFISDTFFLNQVIYVQTILNPRQLLEEILKIEKQLGRLRFSHINNYTNRHIDIDILLFDDKIIQESDLVIPHPFMHERRFILQPLNEIAANLLHPILKKRIKELLVECIDKTKVQRYLKYEMLYHEN